MRQHLYLWELLPNSVCSWTSADALSALMDKSWHIELLYCDIPHVRSTDCKGFTCFAVVLGRLCTPYTALLC